MDELNDNQLKKQMSVGRDVEDLAHHPAFVLIMDRLKNKAAEATKKLIVEEDMKEIKRLQNIIWRHDEEKQNETGMASQLCDRRWATVDDNTLQPARRADKALHPP